MAKGPQESDALLAFAHRRERLQGNSTLDIFANNPNLLQACNRQHVHGLQTARTLGLEHYGHITPAHVYNNPIPSQGLVNDIEPSYYPSDYQEDASSLYINKYPGDLVEYHGLPSFEAPSPENGFSSPDRKVLSPKSNQDSDSDDAPYAQLIYRALMSTETRMMSLQQIYDWVAENSNKARNHSSKGWQNSIRHNLSMNAAFEAVRVSHPDAKPQNVWVLTEDAVRNGVISTTRYRKPAVPKTGKTPSPRRQKGVTKGGKASGVRPARRHNAKLELQLPTPDAPEVLREAAPLPESDERIYAIDEFTSYGRPPLYGPTTSSATLISQMGHASVYPEFPSPAMHTYSAQPHIDPLLSDYPTFSTPTDPLQFNQWSTRRTRQ